MAARALWKGRLIVGKLEAAVNLFTAVRERKGHFHLLHATDLTPIYVCPTRPSRFLLRGRERRQYIYI